MKARWSREVSLALVLLSLSFTVVAAELRGRLVGLSGAIIDVSCPGGSGSAPVGVNGNYVVRGLPGGQVCRFSVRRGSARSAPIQFNTSRSLTLYSGSLSTYGSSILVTRQ